MLLSELIQGLPIDAERGDPSSVRVGDLTEDSRTAVPGSLFVARPGLVTDGRRYAAGAVAAGAVGVLTGRGATGEGGDPASGGWLDDLSPGTVVLRTDDVALMTAVLAERIHGSPSRRLLLVGVTGTNGKSTVAHLVHRTLNRCGLRCGLIGTVEVDDGTEIAPAGMTTPPAIETSRTLATMVEAGCDAAVMEVSSHALAQRRADGLAFDAAVFTNITGDHADYHGSFGAYLEAKRRLFALLGDAGPAILNMHDANVWSTEASQRVGCRVEPAEGGVADWAGDGPAWSARVLDASLDGMRLDVRTPGGDRFEAAVPLVGAYNAMNALQAAAACWAMLGRAGIEPARRSTMLRDALSLAHPPAGRIEPAHGDGDDVRVFVDYAHTDDALANVLAALRPHLAGGRLWVVFGAGGDRDRDKRPRMGAAAAANADAIVLTSDNPRSESPSSIVSAILAGVPAEAKPRVRVQVDRRRAIEEAVLSLAPGDTLVISGKGHEREQVMRDADGIVRTRPFCDIDEARAALRTRRTRGGTSPSWRDGTPARGDSLEATP